MVKLTQNMLKSVSKPARYTGNEYNMIDKVNKIENIKCRFAFCFPDTYEIGMSHLGGRIIYDVLNKREDTYCERVYAPWLDMEELMRKNNIPLFSLETKSELNQFDIVAFTLQYEMSYTNILNMLDLGGISIMSDDRKENKPFICAGGPCSTNPAPLSKFVDFFMIGEGEDVLNEVVSEYINWKENKEQRIEFLLRISKIKGVYVPKVHTDNKKIIIKRIIENFNDVQYPERPIVPNTDIVHDRAVLEVFRGCIRGCRFCQAGYIYRPVREKKEDKLLKIAKNCLMNTGYEEISLSSLSTSDYTDFQKLTSDLVDMTKVMNTNLSLPSLRIDNVNVELLKKVQSVRKSGLTFAPEAGSQRLRDVINKGIMEEDILNSAKLAFENGWGNIKLYFMIGLPTESYEDLDGIIDLAKKVVEVYCSIPKGQNKARRFNVTVSVSTFVPKPHTPFQWCRQDEINVIKEKQMYLKDRLKHRNITFNYHSPEISMLEAVIAKGDGKIADVIYEAHKLGCKFDTWGESFDFDKWLKAFEITGIDYKEYANREIDIKEELPWDNIFSGVSKEFLQREYIKSKKEEITLNCRKNCSNCGIIREYNCELIGKNK